MAVTALAGTTLGISASAPTTFDAAGYAALTFVNIGEVTDPGEHGKVSALITHMPVATRTVQKYKGSVNQGTKNVQLALDREDAGQILAKAAVDSDATYYFEQAYPNGDIDYFPAKVMSFTTAGGNTDTLRAGSITLEVTANAAGVGIIEVTAP